MESRKPLFNFANFTIEQSLYALAFGLALGVRLLALGDNPLTEYEAGWANQALALSRGESLQLGSQPLYLLFTTLVFWLVKADEAWARLLPALCGSLLTLLPLIFWRWTRSSVWARRSGLVMAFALALDPALVALSRQAGSSMPALSLLLLAFGFGFNRHWRLAAVTAGLALLAGPSIFQGLLGLGLAKAAAVLLARFRTGAERSNSPSPSAEPGSPVLLPDEVIPWRTILIYAGGVVLLAGTLFSWVPQGLGAFASELPAYLQGWLPGSSDLLPAAALRLPLALVLYQPLAVIFAGIAAVRAWKGGSAAAPEHVGQQLSLWALLALLAAMIYPSRQVADAAWALIPLWALASMELARCVPGEEERRDLPIILIHTALTTLFSVLFAYNLLRMSNLGAQPWLFTVVLLGIAMMILVITFIIAAGWSIPVAWLGVVWGSTLVLGVLMVSQLRYSGFTGPSYPGDLWGHPPAAGQAREFMQTLGDLSEWRTGNRGEIEILVTVDSPALRWLLRGFPNVQYADGIPAGSLSPVIITSQQITTLELAAAYRGQDFIWTQYPGWGGLLPVQRVEWLYFHKAPASSQQIILWVRGDMFPGGVLSSPDSTDGEPATSVDEEPIP